jgi:agmatinase
VTQAQRPAYYRTLGTPTSKDEFFQSTRMAGILSFLGAPVIPPIEDDLRRSAVGAAVLGIPWEGGSMMRPGPSYGPRHIRLASEQYRSHHVEFQVDLFESLNLVDCGDVAVVPSRDITFERARQAVGSILRAGAFPVVFGGDDSITIPVGQSVAQSIQGSMGYVHIDAHSDTWDEVAGEYLTAGSPTRRIAELPNVNPNNVAIIGLNGPISCPPHFSEYVEETGISVTTVWDVEERGVQAIIDEVVAKVWNGTAGVLLHTDLDVLDQAFVGGVGAPEVAGLSARELVRMIRAFARQGVSAYVIPECSPVYDLGNNSARVAVRLAMDVLAIRANPGGTGTALGQW